MVVLVVLAVFVLMVVAAAAYTMGIYNALVALDNNALKAWSNIDVLLKQRRDEIPKLVKICEGYMQHERETLQQVIEARGRAQQARGVAEQASAEAGLMKALSGLFAVVERYPELKANNNFMALARRVSSIEDQIADRRELYNASVNNYNIRIRQLPDVLIARPMNYEPKQLYRVSAMDREDVEIEFGGGASGGHRGPRQIEERAELGAEQREPARVRRKDR